MPLAGGPAPARVLRAQRLHGARGVVLVGKSLSSPPSPFVGPWPGATPVVVRFFFVLFAVLVGCSRCLLLLVFFLPRCAAGGVSCFLVLLVLVVLALCPLFPLLGGWWCWLCGSALRPALSCLSVAPGVRTRRFVRLLWRPALACVCLLRLALVVSVLGLGLPLVLCSGRRAAAVLWCAGGLAVVVVLVSAAACPAGRGCCRAVWVLRVGRAGRCLSRFSAPRVRWARRLVVGRPPPLVVLWLPSRFAVGLCCRRWVPALGGLLVGPAFGRAGLFGRPRPALFSWFGGLRPGVGPLFFKFTLGGVRCTAL